mmetsp:Transcript_104991/g.302110  ORF Transcript_104991/g.302110 Transcript_104991/m.302110 type:complete len:337 (-) Transcript_104991:247-1257(-)
MAPPFGFNFSFGILRCSMVMVAWDAKASLISKMSMSSMVKPAFSKAGGMAKAGPMPMSLGSTPTIAKLRMRATMGRPSFFASLRRAMRRSEAPSESWLALPAVVEPPSLKLAFSLAKDSIVTPSRGPSSFVTVTCLTSPVFLSLMNVVTGTISESNSPFFWAAIALACDSTAMRSCCSRVMPYFSATFSEVMPMGRVQALASSTLSKFGLSFSRKGVCAVMMLYMDMLSTPPARPTSMVPVRIATAVLAMHCRPLAHCRLTPTQGISKGNLLMNMAMRVVAPPAVGCNTLPIWASPMTFGSIFVRLIISVKRGESMSSAGVSLKLPLLARPTAVRM